MSIASIVIEANNALDDAVQDRYDLPNDADKFARTIHERFPGRLWVCFGHSNDEVNYVFSSETERLLAALPLGNENAGSLHLVSQQEATAARIEHRIVGSVTLVGLTLVVNMDAEGWVDDLDE